jgi:peptidoglycan/LPS O-acetylase OafA/YrhL
VDIFFVLSGYLITNVIWREALDRGFSIARFYERRVRRIMPALIAVMIVVSAFAIALLLPIDLLGYAKSVFASLGFVANIYFWRDTDYFARLAEQKPLLHVWSLGVEEQFYILFPLIVVLCIRWRRSALLPLTSALVIISFLANVVAHRVSADNPAFFLLPTRAWEIGAGAVLALMPTAKISNAWLRHGLALLAAALIIVGLCFKDPPGKEMVPVALWVVLGATLAMHLGNAGGSWLTQGLSKAPLVWIGLISYSLYLWHWPILVFIRYYFVQTSLPPVEMAIAVMLMFALATLSWRYVERPFRNRSMPVGAVLTWVACGCILVAAASAAVFVSKGFPSRYNAEVARINAAVGTEYRCAMNEYIPFGGSRGCLMALPGGHVADATVALFGNSHAQMYAPIVTDILRENNQGGILVPMNGCLPLPDFNPSSACMALAAQNMREVENLPNIRVVILAMTWWNFIDKMYTPAGLVPRESESKVLIESLDRVIQELERRGITVVLVGPICSPGWDSASIVARKLAFHREIDEPLYLPQSAFMAKLGVGIEHYASRDDLIFIRPDLIQCKLDKCDYFRDGASIFADESHIAEDELPLFRPVFEPALKRALLQSSQSKH